MDLAHFFTPDLQDEPRKGKYLIVQGEFCKIIDVVRRNYVFQAFKWEMSDKD
jgi:hypothetical protein